MWHQGFADVIKLSLLRSRYYPRLSRWAQCNLESLEQKDRRVRIREIFKDAMLLSLKMVEGVTSQEVQAAFGNWKR